MSFGILQLRLRQHFSVQEKKYSREEFLQWCWQELTRFGLNGVHEGTVLSEDAFDQGLEAQAWTVDSEKAPLSRDWVGDSSSNVVELYFESVAQAQAARKFLAALSMADELGALVVAGQDQDWNESWKKNFQGVLVPPFWKIIPSWEVSKRSEGETETKGEAGELNPIILNPGAGFGTGTHETTQLCLQILGEKEKESPGFLKSLHVTDFGSGSGILAIAAASLGAKVSAIEIDELAIDNAKENLSLNAGSIGHDFEHRVHFFQSLAESGLRVQSQALVFANILRPVLLQFAEELVSLLRPKDATLILSGLIEPDVEIILNHYQLLIEKHASSGSRYRVLEKNEWRAIEFSWKS